MSYLIKDTTEEKRRNIANKALAILLSGAEKPSKDVLILTQKYIDGEIELDEIKKIIIKKYNNSEDKR